MSHPQATKFTPNPVKSLRVNGADLPILGLSFFDRKGFLGTGKVLAILLTEAHQARASWHVSTDGVLTLDSSIDALNKTLGIIGPADALVRFVRAWEIVDIAGMIERSFDKVNDLENTLRAIGDAKRDLNTLCRLETFKRQGRMSAKDSALFRALWHKKAENEALVATEEKTRKSLAFAEKCLNADRQTLEQAKAGEAFLTRKVKAALAV